MIQKLCLLLIFTAVASLADVNTTHSKVVKKVYPRGTIATH